MFTQSPERYEVSKPSTGSRQQRIPYNIDGKVDRVHAQRGGLVRSIRGWLFFCE